jgi:hypothetical protein
MTHHQQQHTEPEPEAEPEAPPMSFKTQPQVEEDERPPMGMRPPTQHQPSSGMQGMMAAPSYRMPMKKKDEQSKKPAPFTPQNVQIVSGKAIDHNNPFNETEDDKKETPRRESGRSNASTPTREEREETIKQQQHFVQPTHQPPQQVGKIHNLATHKPRMGTSCNLISNH